MTPAANHPEAERLLDLAYGELSPAETAKLEAHVGGCPGCTRELAAIGGVRRAMAVLTKEEVPQASDAGLESLLAYAQQAAQRSREVAKPPSPWRRWGQAWTLGVSAACAIVLGVWVVGLSGTSTPSLSGVAATSDEHPREALAFRAPSPAPEARESFGSLEGGSFEERVGAGSGRGPPAAERNLGQKEKASAKGAGAPEASRSERRRKALEPEAPHLTKPGQAAADGLGAPAPAAASPRVAPSEAPKKAAAPSRAASGAAESKLEADAAWESEVSANRADQGTGRASQPVAQAPPPPPPPPAPGSAAPAAAPAPDRVAGLTSLAQRGAGTSSVEVERLEAILASGVKGEERQRALTRLCKVQDALGASAADVTCASVMAEFPDSPGAAFARARQARQDAGRAGKGGGG